MSENTEKEIDPNNENREDIKKKCDLINEQLKSMVQNIPPKYQEWFPSELLLGLAGCLTDNMVFEIVDNLLEIQHTTEKQLHEKRSRLIKDHNDRIKIIEESNFCEEIKKVKINVLSYRCRMKLKNFDKEIIKILDHKREHQQNVLSRVEIPGFQVTSDPKKIQVQIILLGFIFKLSGMKELR